MMKKNGIIRLGLGAIMLAAMLFAAGCATTSKQKKNREYRQQRATERFCDALAGLIIESF